MEYKEFTGKTADEAIEAGLNELGLSREEADIRILEEGKKKLFGYVKARVEIAPKAAEWTSDDENGTGLTWSKTPDKNAAETNLEVSNIHRDSLGRTDGERAVEFLEGLLELLKITACTELKREGEKIEIEVTAANTKAIIGRHGEMLDAIQTVAGAVANTGREEYKRVVVDCENYRENREATLQNLAYKLAGKAVRYAEKIKLEPMNPYERRIIHAALSGRQDVTTESEGKEPYRYIVIVPSNLRDPDAPAYSAREDRSRGGFGNRGYHRGYNGYNNGYNNGYRKPYNNREGRDGDGYRKPYNRGGRRPYNQDGEYRKPYYNNDGYKRPYNQRRDEGGTDFSGEKKPYDKPRTSYKKPSSDFFGTYLGNSKDKDNGEE